MQSGSLSSTGVVEPMGWRSGLRTPEVAYIGTTVNSP